MKAFIWYDVGGVSGHFHNNGGLLIIERNLDEARALLRQQALPPPTDRDMWGGDHYDSIRHDCGGFRVDPDLTLDLARDAEAQIITFPNAGCC